MSTDSNYCYRGADFEIKNGILIGEDKPVAMDNLTNFGETLLDRLRANPSHVGQIDAVTGNEETFAKMEEKSVKCAMWLREQNVQPGDVIGVCTHNQPDMYVPCFATYYVGGIFNAWWDADLTVGLSKHFLTLTKPKFLFVDEETASTIHEAVKELGVKPEIILFGKLPGFRSLEKILSTQKSDLVSEFRCEKLPSFDEIAAILYTSGSTGPPKGVLFTHRCIYGNVMRAIRDNLMIARPKSMWFSPLAWLSGFMCMFKIVFARETRIIHPKFSEEVCLELVEKYKVDWMFLGTSSIVRLQMWPSREKYDLSSLKTLMVGGAAIKEKTFRTISESFPDTFLCQGYATTEMGSTCFCQRPGSKVKQGSCGTIYKGMMMKILDPETGKILGPNETGEVCVKTPFMTKGYMNNPEATEKLIDSEGWLHTGDLCYYDEEGDFFFVGRSKDMIKYRENHVPPVMVEEIIQTHPNVLECAVLGIPHDVDDEHPMAFVTKAPNAEVTEDELIKLVADTLPEYMRLRGGVKFLPELPHTASGKIAKNELSKLLKSYACE